MMGRSGHRTGARHRDRESAGPRHRERRAPTQRAPGPHTESASHDAESGDRAPPAPARHREQESAGARRTERGVRYRERRESTWARHRERRDPTQRARERRSLTQTESTGRAPGLDTESARPRHRERRESAGARFCRCCTGEFYIIYIYIYIYIYRFQPFEDGRRRQPLPWPFFFHGEKECMTQKVSVNGSFKG